MSNQQRIIVLVIALALIALLIFYFQSFSPNRSLFGSKSVTPFVSKEEKANKYSLAKELVNPDGFINSDNITIQELIGKKVILVDFWTYSCINCQRTTPYLNAWYEKYKDKGLEIIGVHTPEFAFEEEYDNVKKAVEQFGIKYPVILDNEYATWNAYKNRYWPRKYLIDIDGYIVYDHIGEGAYEETERKIQDLLEERMAVLDENGSISRDVVKTNGDQLDLYQSISPEIYFGSSRNSSLGNGKSSRIGIQQLSEVSNPEISILYLSGEWNFTQEYSENNSSGAKIIFKYQGKNVYFVSSADNPVKMSIFIDGQPVSDKSGVDVKNGAVEVKDSRLYHIIEDSSYGEHILEMVIENPGLKAFTFTFG